MKGLLQWIKKGILLLRINHVSLLGKTGTEQDLVGKKIDCISSSSFLRRSLETGKEYLDQEQVVNGKELISNTVPIIVNGDIVGAVNILRDKSEIKQLAEQLTGVQLYADALRAQSHEFMNQLHCVMGLIHLKNMLNWKTSSKKRSKIHRMTLAI